MNRSHHHSSATWVLERVHDALVNQKGSKRIKQLVYLLYLIKFYNIKEQQLNRVIERFNSSAAADDQDAQHPLSKMMGNAPTFLVESILERFTQTFEGKIKISERLRDKLLSYILCLALTLDGYHLEVSNIAKDIGISVTKATNIVRELGCRVETRKHEGIQVKVAVLAIPLTFPQKRKY